MIKKLLFASIIGLAISSTSAINLAGCKKHYFKVSAYYSPIAGQHFYYKGNYYLEKRLNGQGIRGASGKRVFNGMLAASKKYKFGTKIYFPGLGVGQVEDRGNAIVSAGKRGQKYDRIDIWVGKGDKALMRALSFGKQVRVGYVCPSYKKIKVGFDYSKFHILNNFFNRTLWSIGLSYGRKDNWVRALQDNLRKLGFLKHRSTGFFGRLTKKALIDFQKRYGIRTKYLGYFGPKTRYVMKQVILGKYKNIKSKPKNTIKEIRRKKQKLQKIQNTKIELAKLNRGLGKGYNTYEVTILQKYLKKLGYYKGTINGKYDKNTLEAVAKFQIDYKIIKKDEIYLAGYFGPKTRTTFKKVVIKKIINL